MSNATDVFTTWSYGSSIILTSKSNINDAEPEWSYGESKIYHEEFISTILSDVQIYGVTIG